ncbi:MAG: phosphoadenylyl-sulfate reductase [Ilumatobacteraceae bacterium]|nr:phosphoadenylyl-sulfate reductase [Ilumatobacter sp.]MCB0980903.1 phosphoadenylyl-sulfate reductase [Ilumatobacter sp.]MCO5331578.1 phosphoadenylyl-sulfate reductase [Ilumatobacteraceae bacterium]
MTVAPDQQSTRSDPDHWRSVAAGLEGRPAEDILAWAAETFGGDLVATVSFEDAALPYLVATHAPAATVAFLDTQYHFAETWWLVEATRRRLGGPLRLEILRPGPGVLPDDRWVADPEGCCAVRKVEPLGRALAGRAAWITGIRRIDGPTRAAAPVVEWDDRWGVVKINPLVAWSDADLEGYQTAHDLPRHPLASRGYPSIGCWPCTRPVADGEDRRAGRWAGLDKTECGLHLGAAGTDAGTDSAAVAVAVEVR